jgi:rhodanese-related sulfurtransferase
MTTVQLPTARLMMTAQDLIDRARAAIREVDAADVVARCAAGESVVLLDVRDRHEVNLTTIPGAVHLSRGTMEGRIEAMVPRTACVVIVCASGNRSALAAVTLQQMGYADVASLRGGIRAWVEAGGEIE